MCTIIMERTANKRNIVHLALLNLMLTYTINTVNN